MAADIAALHRRLGSLKSDRQQHEPTWADCFDHSLPKRGIGLNGGSTTDPAGQAADKRAELLDGTATDGVTTLSAAIVGGTTPSSARWFEIEIDGADDAGKQWADAEATALHTDIHGSNYDSIAAEAAQDVVVAGWMALFIDAVPGAGLVFDEWPLHQCFIAASKPGGMVDTIMREYTQTAEQCVAEFGTKVSGAVSKAAAETPDKPITLLRAIYPRADGQEGATLATRLPFASVTFEVEQKHILRESGYHEFPLVVPRWSLLPGSVYATGRMLDALPDEKELCELKRLEKQAAALNILPPFKATDDGVLNVGSIKRLQSGRLYAVADMDNIQPITTGANMQLAVSDEERLQAAIRRTLMSDQLSPRQGPVVSATEIHAQVALLRQQLGPIYGRMQAEWLAPMVIRCFMLKFRAGGMAQPPDSIAGKPFTVKFIGPNARSQRLEDVTAMDRHEAGLINIAANTGKVEVLDQYDWDEAARTKAELLGVPRKLIPDARLVAKVRQQRAQAQQEQQQQAAAQQAQATVIDAAGKRMAAAT
jgi:hypothetical protein